MKHYDTLSEFAHPHPIGTFFIFGQLENDGPGQQGARDHLKWIIGVATWQGHYMLTALKASRDWSDAYLRRFEDGAA